MCLAAAGCGRDRGPRAKTALTIATGGHGGAFYLLASGLAQAYAARLPDLATHLVIGGSSGDVDAVQKGTAQIGFTQADIAYLAYSRGTRSDPHPHSMLRGIAVLWSNTAQIIVPKDSTIRDVSDLRGRRVAVGTLGSGTETLAHIILEAYGIQYSDIHPAFSSFSDMVAGIRQGRLDAAFVVAGVPTPAVREMDGGAGIRLLDIDSAKMNAVRGRYPFLRLTTIPPHTYPGQTAGVATVSIDDLLVCRKDLSDGLVYRLTKTLFEALPSLAATNAVVRLIRPDEAPGTPIPLHPGAARYYREREISQ